MGPENYGKMAKWLINGGYGNTVLVPLFNQVYASGRDSIDMVKVLENRQDAAQNLYTFLKDMYNFKANAITETEFNDKLFNEFKRAGGDAYDLVQMGGYRKKRKNKRKTYKKKSKKGKKTRRH